MKLDFLQTLRDGAVSLVPTAVAVVSVILFVSVTGRLLERRRIRAGEARVLVQSVTAVLSLAGVIVIILALPVSDSARGQLLGLLGVLVSASIALSSSTMVGNAMAGLLIRFVSDNRLRPGDYIRVEDYAGRVTEMGILHTLIQTETRDLTSLPNLWMVSRPVTLRQRSGTIVNTTVGLGYDADRSIVRAALLEAAERAELKSPFVRVEELGDFAVTYKVGGLLTDLTRLFETYSRLRATVIDALHAAKVEIVSPTVTSTRFYSEDKAFIPAPSARSDVPEQSTEDRLMFDQAAAVDRERRALRNEYDALLARRNATRDPFERKRLTAEADRLEKKLAEMQE